MHSDRTGHNPILDPGSASIRTRIRGLPIEFWMRSHSYVPHNGCTGDTGRGSTGRGCGMVLDRHVEALRLEYLGLGMAHAN
ncbi:hypothetical protein N7527_003977 [Penicillium freii]|nr:hypothetical protein N7527_003977 [Penicillium freii]